MQKDAGLWLVESDSIVGQSLDSEVEVKLEGSEVALKGPCQATHLLTWQDSSCAIFCNNSKVRYSTLNTF